MCILKSLDPFILFYLFIYLFFFYFYLFIFFCCCCCFVFPFFFLFFFCQLHRIAFDRLKYHTPFPCPTTQSINILLKFHCVFFILNFTIANTIISKTSNFRLNIWWDVTYVQREQQGTKNGALGTPDKTGAQSDFTPFTTTCCCLKYRKESIHFNVLPPIP